MSAAQKGRKHSPERVAINRASHAGQTFTSEQIAARCKPIGSTFVDYQGYVRVKIAEPNIWEREHRVVMAEHLGRSLLPTEVVHHINEVKADNRKENLQLFENQAEHQRHHEAT